MRVEGDVWLVGVGGNEGAYPGRKPEDLMEFAQQVRTHCSTVLMVFHDSLCRMGDVAVGNAQPAQLVGTWP